LKICNLKIQILVFPLLLLLNPLSGENSKIIF
jgi:hypothetical protein